MEKIGNTEQLARQTINFQDCERNLEKMYVQKKHELANLKVELNRQLTNM